jgi:hypothetical protein
MSSMSRASVLLCMMPLVASCTATTHADDYETVEPPPDERLCAQCASRPDLSHPPCPPESLVPQGDQVVLFAMQALDLGARSSGWTAGYRVGLDQDCSDRPEKRPVQCEPRNLMTQFDRLSNGIDNALATQVFFPIIQSEGLNPQTLINQSLEIGYGGVLLVIDGWNGLPDDDQVGVRMLPMRSTVGMRPPTWDGADRWVAFSDRFDPDLPGKRVPDTDNKTPDAYVTDGTLVWDARAVPAFLLPFGAGGALVDVRLSNVVLTGELKSDQQPRRLVNAVLAGVWSAFLASRNAVRLAEIMGQCDVDEVKRLTPEIEDLIAEAPDMLLPTSQGAATCDAISVGFLGSWVEIDEVAELEPVSAIPQSCFQ